MNQLFQVKRNFKCSILLFAFLSGCGGIKQTSQDPGQSEEVKKEVKKAHVFDKDELIKIPITKRKLKNGLTVIIGENKRLPIVSFYLFYDVGGRYESREAGTTGATHFLEHLMFKGSKKFGPGKFEELIEGNGGRANAYTNFDSTVYYESLPSRYIGTVLDLEADRMQNLRIEKDSFEKERKVVLEERKVRYENSAEGKLFLKTMQGMFEGTPYGGSVIGDVADLNSLNIPMIKQFYKDYYAPNNGIIVIIGDVDAEKLYADIEKKFGDIPPNPNLSKIKKKRDEKDLYRFQGRYHRSVKLRGMNPNPIFNLVYKGVPLGDKRSYALDIVSSILGDGASSYLQQRYVKGKKPVLNRLSVGNYGLKYSGIFYLSGELLRKTNLKRFKRQLLRDVQHVCRRAIDEQSLQRVKNNYLLDYYLSIQSNKGMAHFLGLREKTFGDMRYYKKELEFYNSLSIVQIKEECENIFSDRNFLFVSIWNKHPKRSSR